MCAHVSPQQPGSGEGLAAGGADAGQRVGADVHLERPHAAVLLSAVVAGVHWPVRGLRGGAGLGDLRQEQLLLLLVLELQLVGRQGLGALVALAAATAVVEGRSHVGAGGVGGAAAVLLSLAAAAAAGGGAGAAAAAQVHRAQDGGRGRGQGGGATGEDLGDVAGEWGDVALQGEQHVVLGGGRDHYWGEGGETVSHVIIYSSVSQLLARDPHFSLDMDFRCINLHTYIHSIQSSLTGQEVGQRC